MCTIIVGHSITAYTYLQGIKFENFTTERVLSWRLLLEEYGIIIRYIKGPESYAADVLIRIPFINSNVTGYL